MIITLVLKNGKSKEYDLTESKDITAFKKLITCAINTENISRLREAEKQLVVTNDNSVAEKQLLRIQTFLVANKKPKTIKKKKAEAKPVLGEESKREKKADDSSSKALIDNPHFFPRSEYYTRFQGTTIFAMDEPDHWGTYHRSESTRFFSLAGSRKEATFSSPCAIKPAKSHSFFAHTGGFHSPFRLKKYSNEIKLEKQIDEGETNVRDHLLLYKNKMAKIIVEQFALLEENQQQIKKKNAKKKYHMRPIVYTENNYPCVLIALPALNPAEINTEAAEYWKKHPKPFQKLLLCSFIGFLNVAAIKAKIPIEMVLRASFGHNLPSVCETNNTFRINVGVIPKCYAQLIGETLHKLNEAINKITDEASALASFDADFLNSVRVYNAKKLKKAIKSKPRYKKLLTTPAFKEAEHSEKYYEELHNEFRKINEEKKEKGIRKGHATFIPVNLAGETTWKVIRQAGNSMGKPILSECFRAKGTEDWFANQVMDALLKKDKNPIETALNKLIKCMSYGETATMDYTKIHRELKCAKRQFPNPSFAKIYADDEEFSATAKILCDTLAVEKPTEALYAVLEQAGTKLFSHYRGSATALEDSSSSFGSDSEFSDELTDEKSEEKSHHISHAKLRVCSGMKAILLAQYGALSYLSSQKNKKYGQDIQQMYYEVEGALKTVSMNSEMSQRIKATSKILHFDLNHCNATNKVTGDQQLKEKLDKFEATIIVLDSTSSTSATIKKSLAQCFSRAEVKLVMLVDSGLKNNQGGLDFNPYGEVRVCGRDRKTIKDILKKMRKGLSKEDKLVHKAHELVRVCKRKGMAFSLLGLFKTKNSRFKAIEENKASESKVVFRKGKKS